jgi:hypothetical protein
MCFHTHKTYWLELMDYASVAGHKKTSERVANLSVQFTDTVGAQCRAVHRGLQDSEVDSPCLEFRNPLVGRVSYVWLCVNCA